MAEKSPSDKNYSIDKLEDIQQNKNDIYLEDSSEEKKLTQVLVRYDLFNDYC